MYTVTKDNFTIEMNVDMITKNVNSLRQDILHNNTELVGTKMSRTEILAQLDNIIKVMMTIMQLGDKIFDLIPLTKSGTFSRSSSVLVYDTGIKDIFNSGDYVTQDILQLRFISDNEVSYNKNRGYYGVIRLTYKSGFNKEEPIITKDGKIQRVEFTKRNSYIKTKDLKYGYVYKDAKDIRWLVLFGFSCNSSIQKFYLLRMTKKNEKLVSNCTTISQLSQILLDNCDGDMTSFASKCIEKPKFVEEEGKLLNFDLTRNMSFNYDGRNVGLTLNLIEQEYLK